MNSTLRHKAYKAELKPSREQIQMIERTMGVCRYVYNLFIATNRENFAQGTSGYMSGYDFSKWLNNDYKASNPDKLWIWKVSSKAVKKAIMNADTAYKNFMKERAGFPKFKRRNGRPVSRLACTFRATTKETSRLNATGQKSLLWAGYGSKSSAIFREKLRHSA